jgi:hypothetical protein
VGVQEVGWGKRDTEREGDYIFAVLRNGKHQLARGFFVHHRIIAAVKRVEFVSDRMS